MGKKYLKSEMESQIRATLNRPVDMTSRVTGRKKKNKTGHHLKMIAVN